MYKKILVAIDGSESSNNALEHALTIAATFKAKLIMLAAIHGVVTPIYPPERFRGIPLDYSKEMEQDQQEMRGEYQSVLECAMTQVKKEHPFLKVEAIMKEGRPSATITDLAENEGVDLIVMGSRGIGGYMGWILESTSRRVVNSCTIPILIVK